MIRSGTHKQNKLVAPLMHHKRTYFKPTLKILFIWNPHLFVSYTLTLKTLFAKTPNKVLAVAAEGGLLEESRYKLVVLDHTHTLLPQGAASRKLLHQLLLVVGSPARRHLLFKMNLSCRHAPVNNSKNTFSFCCSKTIQDLFCWVYLYIVKKR